MHTRSEVGVAGACINWPGKQVEKVEQVSELLLAEKWVLGQLLQMRLDVAVACTNTNWLGGHVVAR